MMAVTSSESLSVPTPEPSDASFPSDALIREDYFPSTLPRSPLVFCAQFAKKGMDGVCGRAGGSSTG